MPKPRIDPKASIQSLVVVGAKMLREEADVHTKSIAAGKYTSAEKREYTLTGFSDAVVELQEAMNNTNISDAEEKQIRAELARTRQSRKNFLAAIRL